MSKWGITSRSASLIVAIVYVCLGVSQRGAAALAIGLVLLIPLSLIWFPEWLGNVTMRPDGAETPPLLISFMGWFFLIGFPLLIRLIAT
jgi:hypothetical protein